MRDGSEMGMGSKVGSQYECARPLIRTGPLTVTHGHSPVLEYLELRSGCGSCLPPVKAGHPLTFRTTPHNRTPTTVDKRDRKPFAKFTRQRDFNKKKKKLERDKE